MKNATLKLGEAIPARNKLRRGGRFQSRGSDLPGEGVVVTWGQSWFPAGGLRLAGPMTVTSELPVWGGRGVVELTRKPAGTMAGLARNPLENHMQGMLLKNGEPAGVPMELIGKP